MHTVRVGDILTLIDNKVAGTKFPIGLKVWVVSVDWEGVSASTRPYNTSAEFYSKYKRFKRYSNVRRK